MIVRSVFLAQNLSFSKQNIDIQKISVEEEPNESQKLEHIQQQEKREWMEAENEPGLWVEQACFFFF